MSQILTVGTMTVAHRCALLHGGSGTDSSLCSEGLGGAGFGWLIWGLTTVLTISRKFDSGMDGDKTGKEQS